MLQQSLSVGLVNVYKHRKQRGYDKFIFSFVLSAGWTFVLYCENITKTVSKTARVSASRFTANPRLSRK